MGLFTQQRCFLRWTKPVPKDNSAFSQETRLNTIVLDCFFMQNAMNRKVLR